MRLEIQSRGPLPQTLFVQSFKVSAYEERDFWDPVHVRPGKGLILDPDEFYILASAEALHIPATHAGEMVPYNPLVGEFRVHYAGFFDPGFGAREARIRDVWWVG